MADQEQLRRRMAMEEEEGAETAAAPAPAAEAKPEPSFWQKAATTLGLSGPADQQLPQRLMAAQNGATYGLAPKINALGETALRTIGHGIAPESIEDTTYADALKKSQRLYGDASEAHPVTDLAGALMAPGPKLAGGSFAGRAAKFGALGGAQAAARAYGESPKEGIEALSNAGSNVGIGAGISAGLGAATGPWGKTADRLAVLATGPKRTIGNKLAQMGYDNADDVAQFGRDIRRADLVPWFGTAEDVAGNAKALKSSAGGRIGGAIDAADATGAAPDFAAPVVAARKGLMQEPPVRRAAGGKLRDLLQSIEETPQGLVDDSGMSRPATFRDLQNAKSAAWESVNMNDEAPAAAKLYRQGVGRVAGDVERQIGTAAGDDAAKMYRQGNREFGLAKDVGRLSDDVSTRDARGWGLPAFIGAAGGGYGLGGGKGALAALLTAKSAELAKSHGPAFATRLAQLAEPLEGAASTPRATGSLAEYLQLLQKDDHEDPNASR